MNVPFVFCSLPTCFSSCKQKLSIYYSLNRYYVHAIYETLKKQKLIICVPLPQNILIPMGYIEKYTDICNADLIQS